MSLFDKLLEVREGNAILKAFNRQSRALERIADTLETLLPSPLSTEMLLNNDLKAPPESTFKIYGELEAYKDQLKQRRALIDQLGEEEL